MRQIPLSQGKIVILDDEDFDTLSQYHWCYRGEREGSLGYAVRHARIDGKVRTRYMRREIMNPPPGHKVIFLNHDRRRKIVCKATLRPAVEMLEDRTTPTSCVLGAIRSTASN